MGIRSRVAANRRTVASATVVTLFATTLVAVAALSEGEASAEVDLNDSGVWVTKTSTGLVGRFNAESQALDGSLLSGSTSFDVQQQAGRVLVEDLATSAASPVDIAHLVLDGSVRAPAGSQVRSGGGTVAVLDTDEGTLWVMPFDAATGLDPEKSEPVATVGEGGTLAVSTDGTVFVADPAEGVLHEVRTGPDGVAEEPTSSALAVSPGADVELTTVGEVPVVLDRTASTLVLPSGSVVSLADGSEARLQQPSAESGSVVVATATGLVTQPLRGGDAVVRRASGVPAPPVQLDGCTYGAWSSSGEVVRDCDGTERDLQRTLDGVDARATLQYRVNRHAIVLNDLAAGTLWMAADEFEVVDDWDQVKPEDAEGEESESEESSPEQVDQVLTDRSKPNRPPLPNDDLLGVRPGRTTILPVLANDVDPDGDVMTAEVAGAGPDGVLVQPVLGGAALQATVPADAAGRSSFTYRVSDGRAGGTAEADVTLEVFGWDVNEPPAQTGEPVLKVVQGGTASIKVLPYFRDPEGDELFLSSASTSGAGDEVRTLPDGTVEYRDAGAAPGRKIVELLVSDGRVTAEGRLLVDSVPADQPPTAVNDHVVVPFGETVTVSPLRNDSDPDGDALRLVGVAEQAPAEITPSFEAGTFDVRSTEARSYDLTYDVSDGQSVTTGLVRVDVVAPADDDAPPVVVSDRALLPADGSTLVDVLANDTDPAGGVLVVQSVDVPDGSGISVAVLAHQVLRVTEVRRQSEPVTFRYTASNGTRTAVGEVSVVPVPPPVELRPPTALPDEVTVQAGDVVDIPVLRNDVHPDQLELTLQTELEQDVDPAVGEAFVSEDLVRFRAGAEAGTTYAIYRVRDVNGQEDSAQVTIRVRADEDNAAPRPPEVVARVLSGTTVRIAVPLGGVDPDGDWVTLSGVASPPGKGSAELVDGYLEYTAAATAVGTDRFTYAVVDARGATATGTVRVGISVPAATNQPPVAVDDEVTVRPGRTVAVDVLDNDSDPDGDRLSLVASEVEGTLELPAEVVGDRVVVTTPPDDGTSTFYYAVQDTFGARSSAAVTVVARRDAPLLPPVAHDDVVAVEAVLGRTSVDVAVLENDEDPDGTAQELTVEVADEDVVVDEDGVLTVPLTTDAQVITYSATDVDGLSTRAFVRVPGLGTAEEPVRKPVLRAGITPLEVLSGEPLTIDVADYVVVAEGRTPRLTEESAVTAFEGTREVTGATTIVYTSRAEYAGAAGVTFEVTDGTGPDDPDGATAVLTLPIRVLPPENLPPVLGAPTVDVAAGEETSIDLARFATDPDEDPLTFTVTGSAPGLTTTVEGTTVTVRASADVQRGTTLAVPVQVSDGENPGVGGELAVTVVASTRPLATLVDDVVEDAHQGVEISVPVLRNDKNPFEEVGPLELLGAAVDTGDGSAQIDGDEVLVTPDESFVGVLVVRYRVQDATQDVERQVEGSVTVTVLGKPEAPTAPQVEEVRSKTVVLSWDPPNNNGAEITGYTVTSQNGYEKACATTTCTLDALTNDVEYTFTVVAENAVGPSPASPPSPPARPDEKPDPPAAPTLTFGDRSLTVTWENATYTDRSPIRCVNLEIVPAPDDGVFRKSCVAGTETVWSGLDNGVPYTVTVQAVNDAPEPSEWGAASDPEVPAGVPDAPAAPSATRTDSAVNGGVIGVTWSTPFENGDAVTTYHVQRFRNGSPDGATVPVAGKTSFSATGLDNESSYTFTVTAQNKAGRGATSAASAAVIPYGKPGAPGTPSAALISGDTNGKARVTFGAADANGDAVTYTVRANGTGGRSIQTTATTSTFTGLTNGQPYTFDVQACNAAGCSAWTGRSGSVTPYTTPSTPGVSWTKASATDGYFTVSGPSSDGGNAARVEWSLSGSESRSGTGTGRIDLAGGYSRSYTVQARACNAAGCSGYVSASGTTDAPPPPPNPRAWVVRGPQSNVAGCSGYMCTQFRVHANADFPSGSHSFQCWSNANGYDHNISGNSYTRTLNANGFVDLPCVLGNAYINGGLAQAWVVIDGTHYERTTWPAP